MGLTPGPTITPAGALKVDGSAVTQPVSGSVAVTNAAGAAAVNIQDGGNSITVDGTVAATQSGTWVLGANSGVDIGDVTVNNAAGAAAVNIQDGGNSITVDGAVTVSGTVAATQSGAWSVDVNNAAGAAAVNIQDGGNSITVDGTVAATQSGTWVLGANSGVDIGDVTVNNAAGAAAVNIQDGGNSITVDGAVTVSGTVAATQSGTWVLGANSGVDIGDVTINNAAGAAAVNIQDGGNSITVDGTVAISSIATTALSGTASTTGFASITAAFTTFLANANPLKIVDIYNGTNAVIVISFDAATNAIIFAPGQNKTFDLKANDLVHSGNISGEYTGAAPTSGVVYINALY